MIVAIVGNLGTGKTATLTYLGMKYLLNGAKIYSNYRLKYNYTPVTTYQSFDRVHDGYFLADELWSYSDSRRSFSVSNEFVNDVLLASRKRGIHIFYTTQHYGQIDKRIRDITQYIIYPQIDYIYKGQKLEFKQNFLKPIDMRPFLKYAVVSALVTYAASAEYQFIIESDVVTRLKFLLEPYVQLFDTTEEIQDLAWSELEVGKQGEINFIETARALQPGLEIIKTERSGLKLPTLDAEIKRGNKLDIIDVTTLNIQKRGNGYFHFSKRTWERFHGIEQERHAKTYFAFESKPKNEDWRIVEACKAFDLAEGRISVPRDDMISISVPLAGYLGTSVIG